MSNKYRCLYAAPFADFVHADPNLLFGLISRRMHGEVNTNTRDALLGEIAIMQDVLRDRAEDNAYIIFEYNIPRLGKRIDVVLFWREVVFCLEFKVGQNKALQGDVEQVLDYALDLKNFHRESHDRVIVPILVPTGYKAEAGMLQCSAYDDMILNPLIVGAKGLGTVLDSVISQYGRPRSESSAERWINSVYAPTPTIVEAARTLYENHSVEDITRHEAGKASTDATINYILDVINQTKERGEKSICFVTGVPGAGKTLVGLDIAVKQTYQNHKDEARGDGAVYLSGNGPLVAVLSEALAEDDNKRCKMRGEKKNLSDSRREVQKFIQIIHRYRNDMLGKLKTPIADGVLEIDPTKANRMEDAGYAAIEHVAIFDEAQRSWTHKRLANYLARGGTYGNQIKIADFPISEAAFLIWSMDQREDWATIVCLVGGGQEINTGEAGITEWINALNGQFPDWRIYISDKLTEPEYAEGRVKDLLAGNRNVTYSEHLHLSVSMRSFRAEKLSAFVHALLTPDAEAARKIYDETKDRYPIVLTRSMEKARAWLRSQARGSQRTGVLVSKSAARFKPLAVHVLDSNDSAAVHWFLRDKTDARSSNFLEDAATEIQVQGLELDYACVLWDADFRYTGHGWEYYSFDGKTKWRRVRSDTESGQENRKYMLNAYRVLLTRSRIGMVICVPEGNGRKLSDGEWEDGTRLPEFYDGTFEYLRSLGLPLLE